MSTGFHIIVNDLQLTKIFEKTIQWKASLAKKMKEFKAEDPLEQQRCLHFPWNWKIFNIGWIQNMQELQFLNKMILFFQLLAIY